MRLAKHIHLVETYIPTPDFGATSLLIPKPAHHWSLVLVTQCQVSDN